MNKQIFIINGSGGVGKDTFVELITIELNYLSKRINMVINYSSVNKVKEIAREIGWNGQKKERDRKFLSDLKLLTSNYCDMPFSDMEERVSEFRSDKTSLVLFLHIREPEEILRAVKEFDAKSILVLRDSVKHITSNMADKNVFNCKYDYIVENNGTKAELNKKACEFVAKIWKQKND